MGGTGTKMVNQQLTIGDILEPDQNQIRFSKLKLEFIFLKIQTQKQIPDSIYVCNRNLNQNHSNFYVITNIGGSSYKERIIQHSFV
jgi:hypothetical protein